MQRLPSQRQLAREDGAAQRRRDAPEKCSGRNEEISAQRMSSVGIREIQFSGTESDDGAGSSTWSRRAGSNPIMASPSMTRVGVSLLS